MQSSKDEPQSQIEKIYSRLQEFVPIRKRGANSKLYCALCATMEICEICEQNPSEMAKLDLIVKTLPPLPGTNRTYVEKNSDIYQKAARYVFHGDEHHANISRYAITIRRAALQGVTSASIEGELACGGVNKFFSTRPTTARNIQTKCLRLASTISHKKFEKFTLTLRRNQDNSYEVLRQEQND